MYDNDKKNNNNTGLIHFSQLMALRSLSVKRPATDHKLPQNNVVDDSINWPFLLSLLSDRQLPTTTMYSTQHMGPIISVSFYLTGCR